MAIDNLNYYSSWLPAWQQTDKYSSQPWCLKSKNLDIFSSSKSVKATAFSTPTTWDADIIKEEWGLVLKTDWKVYERTDLGDTLVVDPSVDFPVYQVSYEWGRGWPYEDAQRWTPTDMAVKYEWNEWKSFVVFTETSELLYSKLATTFEKEFSDSRSPESWITEYGYEFKKDTLSGNQIIMIEVPNPRFWTVPIKLYCTEPETTDVTIYLTNIEVDFYHNRYYYDAQLDSMIGYGSGYMTVPFEWTLQNGILVNVPIAPNIDGYSYCRIIININRVRREWKTGNSRSGGRLYVDINGWPSDQHRMTIDNVKSDWDTHELYSYLPLRDRHLSPVWEYYWMKWTSFQPLYSWNYTWIEDDYQKKVKYDFVQEYWWENNISMDIVNIISWNDSFYMIGNMDWNWYIIPCDLSWGRWTPYIAYWCTFKWVENIDYLLYLVWEDRGISTLWVFNQQELVPILWWKHEINKNDIIWVDEEYKFDWKIVNWRKNLILATTDNRIFQYWQTYGGKGWAFIYQVPANATITALKANWNDLEIDYSITVNDTTTNYAVKYQDDTPMKNYNTEWEAVYPIVLGNHLLEKEETDLYASFILPSSTTKLEFWGMANHYHFRTFTSEDNATLSETESYKIKWATWNYALKFIERNNNQYTFRLEGDLPLQTTSEMQIIDSNSAVVINYTEFNHFRKIWTIETDKYLEWDFRFTNLNNKLELPKSHSLQIMVKWKWTANYTPELFSVDLVANQRERW